MIMRPGPKDEAPIFTTVQCLEDKIDMVTNTRRLNNLSEVEAILQIEGDPAQRQKE